jgi:hypothetical protein
MASSNALAAETGNTTAIANATNPNAGMYTYSQDATSAVTGVPISQLTSPTPSGLPASTSQYNALTTADAGNSVLSAAANVLPTSSGSLASVFSSLFGSTTSKSGGTTSGTTSGITIAGTTLSPAVMIVGAGLLLYLVASKR